MQAHIDRVHGEMVDTSVARAAERGYLAGLLFKAETRHTALRSAWPARTLREVVASEAAIHSYDVHMQALSDVMLDLNRAAADRHYELMARRRELRASDPAPKDNYPAPVPQKGFGWWLRSGKADWFIMGGFCVGAAIVAIKLGVHLLS